MAIKAIIFDIGGIIASEDNLLWHYPPLCKSLGINLKEFMKARDKYMEKASLGKITGKKMVSLFAKDLKVNNMELFRNWMIYKRKSIKKNYELEKIIKKLKEQDYKIASLSNVLDIHHQVCKEKKIYDVFEFNILSFEVGLRKPDSRIYQLLLNRLKIPAKEVVFIDDYQSCLDGAKKLGIQTILFKNNGQLTKDLRKLGVKI